MMVRIAKAFVDDAPQRLKAARANLMAGDAHAVAIEIHSLKGAAAYAHLATLQKELEALENLADAGNLAAVTKALPEVERLLSEGILSLNKMLSKTVNDA